MEGEASPELHASGGGGGDLRQRMITFGERLEYSNGGGGGSGGGGGGGESSASVSPRSRRGGRGSGRVGPRETVVGGDGEEGPAEHVHSEQPLSDPFEFEYVSLSLALPLFLLSDVHLVEQESRRSRLRAHRTVPTGVAFAGSLLRIGEMTAPRARTIEGPTPMLCDKSGSRSATRTTVCCGRRNARGPRRPRRRSVAPRPGCAWIESTPSVAVPWTASSMAASYSSSTRSSGGREDSGAAAEACRAPALMARTFTLTWTGRRTAPRLSRVGEG